MHPGGAFVLIDEDVGEQTPTFTAKLSSDVLSSRSGRHRGLLRPTQA